MKNKVFLSILLTVVVFELGFSQVRFGLRGSAGITNITNVHQESKSRTGFQIGVSALIPILNNDILFFEPEINYSAQGEFYVPSKIYPGADKQKIFMDYINIPLNAKLYFSDAENELFAVLGPYVGFKVGDTIERINKPTEMDDYKYNSFDMGATIGFGYSFNRSLEISIRYYYGFVDQVENDAVDKNNSTSNLNFGVSYIFP